MAAKAIFRYFVRGCLVAAPLGLTVYIVYVTLRTVDSLLPVPVPGVGLLVTFALLTLVGFLSSNVIGRSALGLADRLLSHVPLVKLVYSSLKDLVGAFVGEKKSFNRPVAVRLSEGSPLKLLGFVTREALGGLASSSYVAVYLPQSYNFAGNVLLAPREHVEPLDVTSSELMTFIVSGGVSGFGAVAAPAPAVTSRNAGHAG